MTAEENKKVVLTFEDLAFVKKDLDKAVELFSEDYIQHNPQVPDGKEGFKGGIGWLFGENPKLRKEKVRIIAEANMVVVHSKAWMNADDPKSMMSIMDIYRLEDGKIAEHWDVLQAVPEKPANDNGMF
jgi:predicted SnoaL-like aldol condensation-catalyzing enzyme